LSNDTKPSTSDTIPHGTVEAQFSTHVATHTLHNNRELTAVVRRPCIICHATVTLLQLPISSVKCRREILIVATIVVMIYALNNPHLH